MKLVLVSAVIFLFALAAVTDCMVLSKRDALPKDGDAGDGDTSSSLADGGSSSPPENGGSSSPPENGGSSSPPENGGSSSTAGNAGSSAATVTGSVTASVTKPTTKPTPAGAPVLQSSFTLMAAVFAILYIKQ